MCPSIIRFGCPNSEVGQKMADGRLLFQALYRHTDIRTHAYTHIHIDISPHSHTYKRTHFPTSHVHIHIQTYTLPRTTCMHMPHTHPFFVDHISLYTNYKKYKSTCYRCSERYWYSQTKDHQQHTSHVISVTEYMLLIANTHHLKYTQILVTSLHAHAQTDRSSYFLVSQEVQH